MEPTKTKVKEVVQLYLVRVEQHHQDKGLVALDAEYVSAKPPEATEVEHARGFSTKTIVTELREGDERAKTLVQK
jgi:hypothetical protein